LNQTDTNNGLKIFLVSLFCLAAIQFFSPEAFSITTIFYFYYLLLLCSIFFVIIKYKKSYNDLFAFSIVLILIAQLISVFTSAIYWNQPVFDSVKATLLGMSYILFFLLIVLNVQLGAIEKIIIILGSLYMMVFLTSFLIYPKTFFHIHEDYGDERGFQRVSVAGVGFLFLFSFYSLKEYLKQKKALWLLIYIITVAFIIMTLTRTYIAVSLFVSFMYLLRKSNSVNKLFVILIAVGFFYLLTQMDSYKILAKQTSSQATDAREDIRMRALTYYLTSFSPGIITNIFGNGEPYQGTSYARFVSYLQEALGYYTSDIGYFGFYVKYGVLAIFAYLVLIYQTIRCRVSDDYLYCKYYLYFIFIISVIIDAPFNNSFIPSIMLAVYVLSSYSNWSPEMCPS
jgi:hypothetical protein